MRKWNIRFQQELTPCVCDMDQKGYQRAALSTHKAEEKQGGYLEVKKLVVSLETISPEKFDH